jgi:multidrug efflux pump subunit AcrA (membrane-fusion protein)
VNIHESQVDLVSVTMPAIITVDAMPNRSFSGKVNKKALLPSSQNQWLTPDVKVYETMVSFDQSDPNLRPGMNATVEIIAEKLLDVLYIPSQSVRADAQGRHFCFRANGKQVPIKLGKRNQSFVVVLEGIALGEEILMAPPQLQESNEEETDSELEKMLEAQQQEKMKESTETPQNGKDESKAESSKDEQNGNGKTDDSGKKAETGTETAKTE